MTDPSPSDATVREAVGVFHTQNDFQAAIDDLQNSGFDRAEISLLAGHKAVEEKLGHMYERVGELEDDPKVPRALYVEKDSLVEARAGTIGGLAYLGAMAAVGGIVASGGALGWAIAGAVAFGGGGGALGAWLARRIGKDHTDSMEEQLAKGGLLLWVRLRDAEHEARAIEILKRHSGEDVHVHELPAPADPDRDPLTDFQPDPFLPRARV